MEAMTSSKVYQDFVPPTELVEEPECDTLLVYLPGYKKEQLRVQLTKNRNLVISGEQPVGENTWRRFQKTTPVSSNCDIAKITAKFEDLILYITLPKLIASAEKHDEKKPTTSQEDQITQQQDEEKAASSMNPEPFKNVDRNEDINKVNDVVERKETAQEKAGKLNEKGSISQNVEDNDANRVSGRISNVKQTNKTAETGEMKGNGDQKHETQSGYFATKLNIRKEVINIVTAILVAFAFGLHVKYTVGSWRKGGKEDV